MAATLNRNAAAGVAAKTLGKRKSSGNVEMLNQDTGESYLKSVDINRNMLRDSSRAGGGKNKDEATTTTTTEKYPMQWGYQVLPTLYSIYQKVPHPDTVLYILMTRVTCVCALML